VIDRYSKVKSVIDVLKRALGALAALSFVGRPWGGRPWRRRWGIYFGVAFVSTCMIVALGWMGLIRTLGVDWLTLAGNSPNGPISYKSVLAEDTLVSPPTLIMEWEEVDGAVRRLEVDRASLKTFVIARMHAIDRDREVLREIGARYLRTRVDTIFDRMKLRIRTYTTWMYGWAASYVKAYMLVGRGFWKSANLVAEGKFDTLESDLEADMTTFIMTEFRDTVIKPDESDAEIAAAWRDTLVFVDDEWTRMRGRSTQAFRDFVAGQNTQGRITHEVSASSPRVKPRKLAGLLPAANVDADLDAEILHGPPVGESLGEQPVVDGIVSRSVRPWVSRVVGITLQTAAAGTAAASAGAIVPVVGSGVGLVVGVTTFLAYHWAFDFVVNEIDEGLNRDSLEATLKASIDTVRGGLNKRLVARLENRIDSAYDAANVAVEGDRTPFGMDLVVRLRVSPSL
jgi:hypothetical protein